MNTVEMGSGGGIEEASEKTWKAFRKWSISGKLDWKGKNVWKAERKKEIEGRVCKRDGVVGWGGGGKSRKISKD